MDDLYLFLHLIFLIIGFGAVIVVDTFGVLWLLKRQSLEMVVKVANVTQKLIWIGWTGLVITGIMLGGLKYATYPLMGSKLFLVALLGINGIFMELIKRQLEQLAAKPNAKFSSQLKLSIILTSTISQIGWWGATILGFIITFER